MEIAMFEVVFEVHPKSSQWDAYLGYAKLLKPELEQVEGFVENVRYKSLTREGWLVSLSSWRDEKALVRWRTQAKHHDVQEKGRFEVFEDYHLRVGEIVEDTNPPQGQVVHDHRIEETEVGPAKVLLLVESKRSQNAVKAATAGGLATSLGYVPCDGLVTWDIFEAVLTPGDLILIMSFGDEAAAYAFKGKAKLPDDARLRAVRIIRDYSMRDRREAPQYYPGVN
jgi:heme-degrading monooxygenase HmoA